MGGRGASSGMSDKSNAYGTQYKTLFRSGNVNFVQKNNRVSETLFETMTKGRVYVTVGGNELLQITYYDNNNKRSKTIDLTHYHKKWSHILIMDTNTMKEMFQKGRQILPWKRKEWLIGLKKYGTIISAENSLGGQNALIDETSVQFRLTAKGYSHMVMSFFCAKKENLSE